METYLRRRLGIACVALAGAATAVAAGLGVQAAAASSLEATTTAKAKGEAQRLIFEQKLATVPGKHLAALTVDYAPGGVSAPHRHGEAVEIFVYVVSGAVRSKVNDGPERIYHAGEFWYEPPGALHGVSANASQDEPARILAVFVAAEGAQLTIVGAPGEGVDRHAPPVTGER